jgi:hypothetical protein
MNRKLGTGDTLTEAAMRYIDSGRRDASQAVGHWLSDQHDVSEFRLQTGFFRADALGIVAELLAELRAQDACTRILIGSNDRTTPAIDVIRLVEAVGMPRAGARIGVVSFAGAYFHPKVLHLTRHDGGQAAYVGSANLTGSGVTGLHVEAGILMDTAEDDPVDILEATRQAIDAWFEEERPGLREVRSAEDVEALLDLGILAARPPKRPPADDGANGPGGPDPRPRLRPLVALPKLDHGPEEPEEQIPGDPVEQLTPPARLALPRDGLPPYVLLARDVLAPTYGAEGLTGAPLPARASGLIIQLSKDSARHFVGGSGTSNITVPVAAMATLRFGLYKGRHNRPRVEFELLSRIIGDAGDVRADDMTNVMVYGIEGDAGHRDVRLLVPRGSTRALADEAARLGWAVPGEDDFALLEWPIEASPSFRLSFLVPGSKLAHDAQAHFSAAQAADQMMGRGACLIPPEFAPPW